MAAGRRGVSAARGRIGGFLAHPDPLTAKSNLIAFVIGGNGPFYPFYVFLLIGPAAKPVLLTMLASPLFLAVPLLSRLSPLAGRAALPLVGTLNTLWCAWLLGTASDVELFLYPCIIIAAMSFRRNERPAMLGLLALPMGVYLWQSHGGGGSALLHFTAAQYAALRSLNIASTGTLLAFLGLTYAGISQPAMDPTCREPSLGPSRPWRLPWPPRR